MMVSCSHWGMFGVPKVIRSYDRDEAIEAVRFGSKEFGDSAAGVGVRFPEYIVDVLLALGVLRSD